MSDHNEEAWGEMARVSRRIALVEQMLLRRILALEAEVAALKGQGQASRSVYPDARDINWREGGMAQVAIDEIMKR